MDYTVKALAQIAGISCRTLRYYDGIGLLKPSCLSPSGYRIYRRDKVDALWQIMFYRELGLSLKDIGKIINSPDFEPMSALKEHLLGLRHEEARIKRLIKIVEKTIDCREGGLYMKDDEKFEGFKKSLSSDNEKKYGAEIRAKYGDEAIDASNAKLMGLTSEEYTKMQSLSGRILEGLYEAVEGGLDPRGERGREIAEMHREWIGMCWGRYDPAAHEGLVQMYVEDERFREYYDKKMPGCARFLRDAVKGMLEG